MAEETDAAGGRLTAAIADLRRREQEEGVDRAGSRRAALENARRRHRRLRSEAVEAGAGYAHLAGLWCALRTSSGATIQLARSLRADGIDAWTPVEVRRVRRPRSKVRVRRELPIIPSIVFADAASIPTLMRASRMTDGSYPSFSIFLHDQRVPLMAAGEIEGLRVMEAESMAADAKFVREQRWAAARRQRREPFPPGTKVAVPDPSFAGMVGTVESGDERFTVVSFGGLIPVKIETFLLLPNAIQAAQS